MTAEKIMEKINSDADDKIKSINTNTKKVIKEIQDKAKKQAEIQAKHILSEGDNQAENAKKILITKAEQEQKRTLMKEREKIIDNCFNKAVEQLANLSEKRHKEIVTVFLKQGNNKLGKNAQVTVSKSYLKDVAIKAGLNVVGSVNTSGGVLISSADGKITLDYTFDSILKREKQSIRVEVGKLLFS